MRLFCPQVQGRSAIDVALNALSDRAGRLTTLDRVSAVTDTNYQQGWLLTAASLQGETRHTMVVGR